MKFFVKSQTPSTALYHYTSARSISEILDSRVLWASSVHCMNDAEEYIYAFTLTRELCARPDIIPPHMAAAILQSLDNDYRGVEMLSKFITSFSEDGDLLSQWRAYTGGGPGFSLGFEPEGLLTIAERNECLLLKCIYGRDDQVAAVQDLLYQIIDHYCIDPSSGCLPPRFGNSFVRALKDLAAAFKDPSFIEEREWRLVTPSLPSAGEHVHFRPGISLLIPYVHVRIADECEPIPISSAIVGPTVRPELSRLTLLDAFATYGCTAISESVINSKSPYRGWW